MTLTLIIAGFAFLLVAIAGIGKSFYKWDHRDELIHEQEIKRIREKAEELKKMGLIHSTFDFMAGANFQRNENNQGII